MANVILNSVVVLTAGVLFTGGMPAEVLAGDSAGHQPAPGEILKRAQDKYTSLDSYSDEGKTVASVSGTTITTTFTIKMARPNLYRIEWEQSSSPSFSTTKARTNAVWSAGQGDFLEMGFGVQKQSSMEMALAGATGISGGAAATIPGTFFKMNWGNQFGGLMMGEKQQADEKVGDEDCYVFTINANGLTKTLWIGKRDYLMHQVRSVVSAEAMKSALDNAAKLNPGTVIPPQTPTAITTTETHTKIVLNPKFSPTSFGR